MNATFNLRNWLGCSLVVVACQSAAFAGGFGGHFGGHSGGMGNSQNVVRSAPIQQNVQTFKVNNNVVRTNSSVTSLKLVNNKVTSIKPVIGTGGITPVTGTGTGNPTKVGGGLKFPNGGVISLPPTTGTGTNPIGGGKFPVGGIKLPPGNLPPVIVADPPLGGGKFPGGGISLPPGTMPPVSVNPPSGGGTTTPPAGGGTMPPANGTGHRSQFPYWLPATFANVGYGGGYGGGSAGGVASAPMMVESAPAAAAAPIQAAPAVSDKLTLKLGQNYTIANESFGENRGALTLQINGLALPVQIDKWDAQQVSFTMPAIGLGQASDGMFQIVKADHSVSRSVPVTVVAAQ